MTNAKSITGGCRCGAVRYASDAAPMMAGHCHCTDCQKLTGSGHTTAVFFPAQALKISGAVTDYTTTSDAGSSVTRSFCPTCGSRLFGKSTGMPGGISVTAGSLDNPEDITPTVSVFAKSRRSWDHIDSTLASFAAMPPAQARA